MSQMTDLNTILPDYLFEVSWEVCNKMGGIYTVVATKALNVKARMKEDHHILIGPDVWDAEGGPFFREDQSLFAGWRNALAEEGIRVRTGRWEILMSAQQALIPQG